MSIVFLHISGKKQEKILFIFNLIGLYGDGEKEGDVLCKEERGEKNPYDMYGLYYYLGFIEVINYIIN